MLETSIANLVTIKAIRRSLSLEVAEAGRDAEGLMAFMPEPH